MASSQTQNASQLPLNCTSATLDLIELKDGGPNFCQQLSATSRGRALGMTSEKSSKSTEAMPALITTLEVAFGRRGEPGAEPALLLGRRWTGQHAAIAEDS